MNQDVIDVHIHFGAPEDEESGCYWSEKFTHTIAYYAMLLITKSLFKKVDIKRVRKHLLGAINKSKCVDKSVLLAMDQVYDENGGVLREKTHLYVPNSYVVEIAKENDRILLGASVHPYRNDWRDELAFCLENQAVLCKWIPSSQMINPTHGKCMPFYKKLAEHKLPLLCHSGPEHAIPTADSSYKEYNNPKYLRSALDQGVTVIIAHCALPYFGIIDEDYYDDFDEFLKLFDEAGKKGWKLYADLSAIATPFRIEYIEKIQQRAPSESLLFGSDYPIPIFELCYHKSTDFFSWLSFILKVAVMKNQLDKNYHLIKGMGFMDSVFTNAHRLFSSIQYPEA